MTKSLVIVESPTKAKTIEKFLGKNYEIKASYGHVRDLPNSAAEIPAKLKKEKWSRIGVNTEQDFEPLYVIPEDKKKRVKELKEAIKKAEEIFLATDEDREGESISWHLMEVLSPTIPVKRLVFHEITQKAIEKALSSARQIDQNLVKAQETRRIIDRLFGYSVSPLLWKKMLPRLSAGRVQSVAIRLLVERERERIAFRSANYWDLKAEFIKSEDDKKLAFEAQLVRVGDKRVATGKDFDPKSGRLLANSSALHLDQNAASALKKKLQDKQALVSEVQETPFTSKPYPPFTTSTLQQESSRKLNLSARNTMSLAQKLYENGLITYMRTDSTTLSEEALRGARGLIERDFGKQFLPSSPRIYKTKVRNAQEAHEAIRPAGEEFVSPAEVKKRLGEEAFRLYELIWKRTIASQMEDARGTRISVEIGCEEAVFRASGKTIEFPGYLRAYVEGSDDPEADLADQEKLLPKLIKGDALKTLKLEELSHTTQAPPRFTEGSLIKELERLGIGRPSTWATIVEVVLHRTYAFKRGNTLVPTFLAKAVTNLMEKYFTRLVDYEFTARLEDDLDAIARGEADNQSYLKEFYFGNGHAGLKSLVASGEETIDPREVCGLALGEDGSGNHLEVRIGRYGPFITNGTDTASLPPTIAPDEINAQKAEELLLEAAKGPTSLGEDPESSKPIYLKTGRYGPYIQLGDQEDGVKPRMVSLLPGMKPEDVTYEISLKLLKFPRSLGNHPQTGEEVLVATGRYGPYIKSGAETRSIPMDQLSPLDLSMEDAVELLKQPRKRGRASYKPQTVKDLGKHGDKTISLKTGRYGPYVTDGKINAALPKGQDPESLTPEQALELIVQKSAK